MYAEKKFQSLIGTVQQKKIKKSLRRHARWFQSLIGTVQQQYLLRFLVSLYPIFPVFQPFSPKKSVNLFIVNSRKALILLAFLFLSKLARRFTDFSAFFCCFQHLFMLFLSWRPWFYRVGGSPTFFTDFLTIFVLIKEKAPVLSQKLKLLLNISITPAIRPSPYIHALHLYSATRKISLSFGERPLTSYPGLRPSLHRNGYLQISPSIQIFPQLFLPYGYFHRLLPL